MRTVYGPLCGVPRMDKIHSLLVFLILIPAGYGGLLIKYNNRWYALASALGLAAAQPYALFYALYVSSCELTSSPMMPLFGPVLVGASFGLVSLTSRILDYDMYHLDLNHVPLIVAWHLLWSFVIYLSYRRVKRRIPFLQASITLEKFKRLAYLKNSSSFSDSGLLFWPLTERSPVDFEDANSVLVGLSDTEQSEIVYTPLLAGIIVIAKVAFLICGIVMSEQEDGYFIVRGGTTTTFKFVTFPLMIFQTVATIMVVMEHVVKREGGSHTLPDEPQDAAESYRWVEDHYVQVANK